MKQVAQGWSLLVMLCLLACGGRSDQRFEPARLRGPAELSLSIDGTLAGVPSGDFLPPHNRFESYFSRVIGLESFGDLQSVENGAVPLQVTIGDTPPDENLPNAGYRLGEEYDLDLLNVIYVPRTDTTEFITDRRAFPRIRVLRIIGDSTDDRDDIVEFELTGTVRTRDLSREIRVNGTFKYDFRGEFYLSCFPGQGGCNIDEFR